MAPSCASPRPRERGRPGGVVDAADIGLWVPKGDAAQPMADSRRKCDVNAMFEFIEDGERRNRYNMFFPREDGMYIPGGV